MKGQLALVQELLLRQKANLEAADKEGVRPI